VKPTATIYSVSWPVDFEFEATDRFDSAMTIIYHGRFMAPTDVTLLILANQRKQKPKSSACFIIYYARMLVVEISFHHQDDAMIFNGFPCTTRHVIV